VYSRLLSTGSLKHIERTTELLKDVMDHDYAGGIKGKLDDVYRSAGNTGGGGRGEKSERECRTSFIVGTPFRRGFCADNIFEQDPPQ
jgi:hypothetical protein